MIVKDLQTLLLLVICHFGLFSVSSAKAETDAAATVPRAHTAPSGASRFYIPPQEIELRAPDVLSDGSGTIDAPVSVGWSDLRPPLMSLEAPFETLPPQLLRAMRTHVKWRTSSATSRQDETFAAYHQSALALLASNDIDVEDLMKARRKIMAQNNRQGRGPNEDIVGKPLRLPGYIVPLSLEDRLVTQFLFVPVAGSCVHTPAPVPNQIVKVDYPKGVAFSSIFDAFWIEGVLSASETISDVSFYDGVAKVKAAYTLTAHRVEAF